MSYFNNNIYDILNDINIGEKQKMIKSDLLKFQVNRKQIADFRKWESQSISLL